MRRFSNLALIVVGVIAATLVAGYLFNNYWLHRYDDLIDRHAKVYNLEKDLVWSVIYEETYFRAWTTGDDNEVGLMQVTPAVAKEWALKTGLKEFEKQAAENLSDFLSDPERNIQIGCWYLEQLRTKYRGRPAERAMMLAAYNAGPSRVEEWTDGTDVDALTEEGFINRINISSTKAYVSSIIARTDGLRVSRR